MAPLYRAFLIAVAEAAALAGQCRCFQNMKATGRMPRLPWPTSAMAAVVPVTEAATMKRAATRVAEPMKKMARGEMAVRVVGVS